VVHCARCQHQNPGDAKFCLECGGRLVLACPACRTELPAGAKFCKECGHAVGAIASPAVPRTERAPESYTPRHLAERILTSKAALEGERKQVTVLFADLKGSMELLADRDPEDARKLLDPVLEHMMEAVHRYEGTVNQVMGDGIMALFGAPLAHEDHAVRACYAALRMQTGRNAFVSADGSWTDVWRWWLGGQIAHTPALCALAAPTVNCSKAFGFSPVAPTNATWGLENRSAAFRMKYVGGENAHIENRIPRGGSNPYLVMAGVLAAGLDGLKNKIEPPPETTGVAHGLTGVTPLPARLEQSLAALESDSALRAALGEEFIKLFLAVKRHEISKARAAIPEYDSPDFGRTVHEWERSEYFEFL